MVHVGFGQPKFDLMPQVLKVLYHDYKKWANYDKITMLKDTIKQYTNSSMMPKMASSLFILVVQDN